MHHRNEPPPTLCNACERPAHCRIVGYPPRYMCRRCELRDEIAALEREATPQPGSFAFVPTSAAERELHRRALKHKNYGNGTV